MSEALDGWSEFNVAMVGATAALAGLLIVAMSVNIGEIMKTATLPSRAAAAIATLVVAIVATALGLVPDQPHWLYGVEVLAATLIACVLEVHAIRTIIGEPGRTTGEPAWRNRWSGCCRSPRSSPARSCSSSAAPAPGLAVVGAGPRVHRRRIGARRGNGDPVRVDRARRGSALGHPRRGADGHRMPRPHVWSARVRATSARPERVSGCRNPTSSAQVDLDHRAAARRDRSMVRNAELPRIATPYGADRFARTASCTEPPAVTLRSDPMWPSKKLLSSSCTA